MSRPDYVIVTPVRNEEPHIQKTLDAVVAQTVPPRRWIIVNDGSTDKTPELIDAAAKAHDWIEPVHRSDRGFRKSGAGVIEAFYEGYHRVADEAWDYLVKLDGDLSFAGDYFERCFAHFAADAKLGIGGGVVCAEEHGRIDEDSKGDPRFHVRGATKIYRHECWQKIGGIFRGTGWDTLDEVKANMLGWTTYTFRELSVLQLKPTGSADGTWRNWYKNGRANYIAGYHPLFMLSKCLRRCFRKPWVIAATGLFWGFAAGYLKGERQVDDPELIKYLRQQQLRRLTFRESIWRY
jgi:glycosyltransferase involved in cell wall biosynthesis